MSLLTTVAFALTLSASPPHVSTEFAEAEVRHFILDERESAQVIEHLRRVVERTRRQDPELARALVWNITQNLREKRGAPPLQGRAFVLSAEAIRRSVIDYEAFKQDAFISSGVFPKRYFGYFDLAPRRANLSSGRSSWYIRPRNGRF